MPVVADAGPPSMSHKTLATRRHNSTFRDTRRSKGDNGHRKWDEDHRAATTAGPGASALASVLDLLLQ